MPGVGECEPILGRRVNCISDDFRGYLAYESTIHAIQHYVNNDTSLDGVLFLHDDVVWRDSYEFGGVESMRVTSTLPFDA